MTVDHARGGRRRLTALRRGERATRGYNRLAASRRGFASACGPRASSISILNASTTERWRTALRPTAPKRHSRCRILPSRAATAKCTRPTGLPGVAPPGPAMPVVETARSTPAFSKAPIAIAVAVSLLTAPNVASVVALTPSIARLASLEYVTKPRSITSEEPGISVSAPATRPPVQDSAVATVSLRIRQRSSSERERARASLPLISVAPGEADGGTRDSGDAFLAAGKSKSFAGGRLHRDPRQRQPRDLGDTRAHGIAQWADFRALADQRHIEVSDASAARGDAIDRIFQELVRRRALPLGIGRRKMRADIAVRERAEDGVDQSVEADVTVGMREKAFGVRHADAADHHVIAITKGVNVVAASGSDITEHGAEASFLADKIFRCRQFHIRRIAFKCRHRQSRPFRKRRVVGEIAAPIARRAAMGVENHIEPERLRCLGDPQPRTFRRRFDVSAAVNQLDGIGDRYRGDRRAGTACGFDGARNQRRRDEWPRGVVDENDIGLLARERFKSSVYGSLARCA